MNHLTLQQLQECTEGQRSDALELHLRSCTTCQAKLEDAQHFDRALKHLPLEEAPADFSQRVMKQLGIKESMSFGWSIVKNLAPLVSFALIIGALFVVLKISGVFAGSNVGESVGQTQSLMTSLGEKFSYGLTTVNLWAQKLFPFAFAKQSYGLTVFLIIFLAVIAILDKFVFAPMFRKRVL